MKRSAHSISRRIGIGAAVVAAAFCAALAAGHIPSASAEPLGDYTLFDNYKDTHILKLILSDRKWDTLFVFS